MDSIVQKILNSKLPSSDKKLLIDQYKEQKSKVTDIVYGFLREHIKDDQKLKDFARNHYEGYLANDPDYSSFEDWYKGCIYDMSGDCWKEGVEDWLGKLKYNGEFDQFLEEIKFQEFLDNMDYPCDVKFYYSDGSYPGDVWSMMIDPSVHINVELLDW